LKASTRARRFASRLAAALIGLAAATASAFDLQVSTFTDSPDPAVAGGRYTYDVVVTNSAGDAAPASTLTVSLDPNLEVAATLPAGCAFEAAPIRQVRCDLPALAGGAVASRAIEVRYTGAGPVVVNSTAAVSILPGDSNNGNNSLPQNTTVIRGANLSITKASTQAQVPQGGRVTFNLNVANAGPNAADGGIRITDTLPGNLTFVSGSGTGWTCGAAGQVVTCTNAGSTPVGGNANQLQIVADLSPGIATGIVTNPASVDLLDPLIGDGDLTNNSTTGTATWARA